MELWRVWLGLEESRERISRDRKDCEEVSLSPEVLSQATGRLDTRASTQRAIQLRRAGRTRGTTSKGSCATNWLNKQAELITWATLGYNFALGFSCWHVLAIDRLLLPRELRPGWFATASLIVGGIFFSALGAVTLLSTLREVEWIKL
jgi:hypothetical protein